MRSPPLAPGFEFETYIVLDDLGKLGRAYREVDEEYETIWKPLGERIAAASLAEPTPRSPIPIT